ncbi:hypothetical protein EDC56_2259 [Sinobacterium caligoides]|uniref:Uncharacterized protein n=1 Tax=Sinobacterium caligoides TaxID=933926 RepID=A0A3N2DPR8_9GAMM|nr:hypothetical protein [Sinobacterium caligoides]ROS01811.1 hypothetical protein EDC56_2259 [Sinobacterium caligoides]
MEISRNQLLARRVVVGLRYYEHGRQTLLDEKLFYGVVVKVMEDDGIVIEVAPDSTPFTLPSDISSWHLAPKASFVVPGLADDVVDPDYLVRWDIIRGAADVEAGEHEWWEWQAVIEPLSIEVERHH